jgi:hypothetical protein
MAIHPLAPFVLALFDAETTLDVTMVSVALAGALVHPAKGRNAYRIVAADVLEWLYATGGVERYGHADPRFPERGGWSYTLKEKG